LILLITVAVLLVIPHPVFVQLPDVMGVSWFVMNCYEQLLSQVF